jgi:predicted DNA-binding transcriptional regulator
MKPDTNDRSSRSRDDAPARRPGRKPRGRARSAPATPWTFLTNHAHVLVCLVRDPDATVESVAREVGITERSARRIVLDLEAAGYLARERVGRRNRYDFDTARPLRHPVERHRTVGALLRMLGDER